MIEKTSVDENIKCSNVRVIVAVPGAGKTEVITRYINEVLSSKIMDPSDIYAITFTRDASIILKSRTSDDINTSTIHSLAYSLIEDSISENEYISYDDMIRKATNLIDHNSDFKIGLLCVDEAQDINEIQFNFIKALAKRSKDVIMVGDPDQSIYSFMGGSPDFMYQIVTDENLYSINQSYRLKTKVANYVNRAFDRDISSSVEGGDVKVYVQNEDKRLIDNLLYSHLLEQTEDNDTGILFRTNDEVREFVTVYGHGRKFNYSFQICDHPYAAIIDVLMNIDRDINMNSFITLCRYFGYSDYRFEKQMRTVSKYMTTTGLKFTYEQLSNLGSDMRNNIYGVVITNTNSTYIKNTLSTLMMYKKDIDMTRESIMEAIEYFKDNMLLIDPFYDIDTSIIADSILNKSIGGNNICCVNNNSMTSVMTVHASKGNQFDNVIYTLNRWCDLYNDEERRISYVAATRTKDKLHIIIPYIPYDKVDHTVPNIYDSLVKASGII